ncbi:MAG TPA: triose-phosphate isomerase [Candidatus Krumholzibacteria bacterium]|nr:triose-phosphate isomerase [Candidatus Krumholzibacteria bacterium]
MPRRKLVAANWKMNKRIADAAVFADGLRAHLPKLAHCDLVVFPPFFCVRPLADALSGTGVAVGAQDLFWESDGAFTGEVSAAMLRDAGASHALVGHSERRHVLGEGDDVVARKLHAALDAGLSPILCVGETLAERESGRQEATVERQLTTAFEGRGEMDAAATVIAYEPVWAIGTGRTATPDDAEAMHRWIRQWLADRFGADVAGGIRIQYGGSAKPGNAGELLARAEIDGLLVGGASLDPASFAAMAGAAPREAGGLSPG